jgi:hypothetical protein
MGKSWFFAVPVFVAYLGGMFDRFGLRKMMDFSEKNTIPESCDVYLEFRTSFLSIFKSIFGH